MSQGLSEALVREAFAEDTEALARPRCDTRKCGFTRPNMSNQGPRPNQGLGKALVPVLPTEAQGPPPSGEARPRYTPPSRPSLNGEQQ